MHGGGEVHVEGSRNARGPPQMRWRAVSLASGLTVPTLDAMAQLGASARSMVRREVLRKFFFQKCSARQFEKLTGLQSPTDAAMFSRAS